ncbi:unnamed protein product [Linum trigynum]|uniref:Reverse transcriptase domain-containing protein n=1 Tax=Linum trigynum TaxID=586398 RepID=A0AAV2ESB7_9ROSI
MKCVTTPFMEILWEGTSTEKFRPTRGTRQGCPLSPYLFTLCIARLSHLIEEAVSNGIWKPIQLIRGGTKLTHLFFADDLVLFAEASQEQVEVIMDCLDQFCDASGELVSKDKSRIYFSKNVKRDLGRDMRNRLGFAMTQDLCRYLGVPVLHGRVKKQTYQYLLDRVDQRLAGWKAESLSLAGRVTLALYVLNGIPIYAMQTSVLHAAICDHIDRRIRGFIWGSQ